MHNTAKCLVPMGTVDNCVRRPWIPVGTRFEFHLISQLSQEMDPFRDTVGEPKGLGNNDDTAAGLEDGDASLAVYPTLAQLLVADLTFLTK